MFANGCNTELLSLWSGCCLQVGHANPPTLLLVIASMARNVALAVERGSHSDEDLNELEFLNLGDNRCIQERV